MHFGREHSDIIGGWLCDFLVKDLWDLDTHLSTCEIYKCDPCNFVTTNLGNMKTHIEKDHEDKFNSHIIHNKKNRINKEEFDPQYYTKKELFSMSNWTQNEK